MLADPKLGEAEAKSILRSQMIRVGHNLRESANNYFRTNAFVEAFPFEFEPIFFVDNEPRDFDLVIHKFEKREHQPRLLEQLERESKGLTSTRFQAGTLHLNDPEVDVMDDRWHIQILLNKMVEKLRSEFPDHRLEAARSELIDIYGTIDVRIECDNPDL